MESGTSLGAEDEIARRQLLFAVLVPEHRTTAEDEEHLLGSEVHVHPRLRRAGGQFVQRCSHPGVVRPPEDPMPSPFFFVVAVPRVGEQVLTNHSVHLQVVAVARSARSLPRESSLGTCANHARLPPRLTAISSAGPLRNRNVGRLRCETGSSPGGSADASRASVRLWVSCTRSAGKA